MQLDKTSYRLPDNKIFKEVDQKSLIVLHFTAGSTTSGAFQSWIPQPIQIGTPYILDPNGTVYEIFDPKYWAYHLAITGPASENHKHDKRSVPIEIVNFGPLKLTGDMLYSWPNNYKNKFCNVNETNKYVKASYRGFDYYAAFPEVQKKALVELVNLISSTFSIPKTLPPLDKRDKFDVPFFSQWTGIASHQNFRPDKFDVGPAFDWSILA